MGIVKLADLIRFEAPGVVSHKDISDYAGKVIALDTSIVVNQFRTATPKRPLAGLFFRTLTFLEHDIKPVFVFDGKPPEEKAAVLQKRAEVAGWSSPSRSGTASAQTKSCEQLLSLLGVPVVQASGDAESLCAWLVKQGTVHAVASEDMDTLPFGGSTLIRQLNAKKDSDVVEYSLPKLLETLKITHAEFVDLCILLGCDYCEKIPGFGPKRALKLIQKHRTIENLVLDINRRTHPVPCDWKYREARKIFMDVPQTRVPELVWSEPDEDALVQFLSKRVKEDRVRRRMERFRQSRESRREKREKEREAGKQTRMEDFFRVVRKREKPAEAAEAAEASKSKNGKKPKLH